MSRIFEALKRAQMIRSGEMPANALAKAEAEAPDRRRSRRWALELPVQISGNRAGKKTFREDARTLRVNENGALLLLSVPVRKGQKLRLTNCSTRREQDCRVVFTASRGSQTIEAGVAFSIANPDFWEIPPAPRAEPPA